MSLPVRGAWIEISIFGLFRILFESLPVRGAWIEISFNEIVTRVQVVAPRKGSVD